MIVGMLTDVTTGKSPMVWGVPLLVVLAVGVVLWRLAS